MNSIDNDLRTRFEKIHGPQIDEFRNNKDSFGLFNLLKTFANSEESTGYERNLNTFDSAVTRL
jgi:hypothetical protein